MVQIYCLFKFCTFGILYIKLRENKFFFVTQSFLHLISKLKHRNDDFDGEIITMKIL